MTMFHNTRNPNHYFEARNGVSNSQGSLNNINNNNSIQLPRTRLLSSGKCNTVHTPPKARLLSIHPFQIDLLEGTQIPSQSFMNEMRNNILKKRPPDPVVDQFEDECTELVRKKNFNLHTSLQIMIDEALRTDIAVELQLPANHFPPPQPYAGLDITPEQFNSISQTKYHGFSPCTKHAVYRVCWKDKYKVSVSTRDIVQANQLITLTKQLGDYFAHRSFTRDRKVNLSEKECLNASLLFNTLPDRLPFWYHTAMSLVGVVANHSYCYFDVDFNVRFYKFKNQVIFSKVDVPHLQTHRVFNDDGSMTREFIMNHSCPVYTGDISLVPGYCYVSFFVHPSDQFEVIKLGPFPTLKSLIEHPTYFSAYLSGLLIDTTTKVRKRLIHCEFCPKTKYGNKFHHAVLHNYFFMKPLPDEYKMVCSDLDDVRVGGFPLDISNKMIVKQIFDLCVAILSPSLYVNSFNSTYQTLWSYYDHWLFRLMFYSKIRSGATLLFFTFILSSYLIMPLEDTIMYYSLLIYFYSYCIIFLYIFLPVILLLYRITFFINKQSSWIGFVFSGHSIDQELIYHYKEKFSKITVRWKIVHDNESPSWLRAEKCRKTSYQLRFDSDYQMMAYVHLDDELIHDLAMQKKVFEDIGLSLFYRNLDVPDRVLFLKIAITMGHKGLLQRYIKHRYFLSWLYPEVSNRADHTTEQRLSYLYHWISRSTIGFDYFVDYKLIIAMGFLIPVASAAPIHPAKEQWPTWMFSVFVFFIAFCKYLWEHKEVMRELNRPKPRRRHSDDGIPYDIPYGGDFKPESVPILDSIPMSTIVEAGFSSGMVTAVEKISATILSIDVIVDKNTPMRRRVMAWTQVISSLVAWGIKYDLQHVVKEAIEGITTVKFNHIDGTAESWTDAVDNFTAKYEEFKDKLIPRSSRTGFVHMFTLFSIVSASAAFTQEMSKDNMYALYEEVKEKIWNAKGFGNPLESMIDTILHVVKLVAIWKDSQYFFGSAEIASLDKKYGQVMVLYPPIKAGTYDKKRVKIAQFKKLVRSLLNDYKRLMQEGAIQHWQVKSRIDALWDMDKVSTHKLNMAKTRDMPFAVYLYGGAGIGKSTMIPTLSSYLHTIAGIEEEELIGYVNASEAYDSTLGPDTSCIVFDDVQQSSKENIKTEDVVTRLIRYMGVNPQTHNKADVDSKGSSDMLHSFLIMTANKDCIDMTGATSKLAMSRRLGSMYHLRLIPKYAVGWDEEQQCIPAAQPGSVDYDESEFLLDARKIRGKDSTSFPFWLEYQRYKMAVQGDTVRARPKTKWMNHEEFAIDLEKQYNEHARDNNMGSITVPKFNKCSLCGKVSGCDCAVSELSTEEISIDTEGIFQKFKKSALFDIGEENQLRKIFDNFKKNSLFSKEEPSVKEVVKKRFKPRKEESVLLRIPRYIGTAYMGFHLGLFLQHLRMTGSVRRAWYISAPLFSDFETVGERVGYYIRCTTNFMWSLISPSETVSKIMLAYFGYPLLERCGLLVMWYVQSFVFILALLLCGSPFIPTDKAVLMGLFLTVMYLTSSFVLYCHNLRSYEQNKTNLWTKAGIMITACTVGGYLSVRLWRLIQDKDKPEVNVFVENYVKTEPKPTAEALTIQEKKRQLEEVKTWTKPIINDDTSKYAKSTSREDFESAIEQNTKRVNYRLVMEDGTTMSGVVRLLLLDDNFIATVSHVFKTGFRRFEFTDPEGRSYEINPSQVWKPDEGKEFADRDLAIIRMNTSRWKPIVSRFLVLQERVGSTTGMWIRRIDDTVKQETLICRYGDVVYNTSERVFNYPGWLYNSALKTGDGLCGTPIIGVGNDKVILGLHTMGNGSYGGCVPIEQKDLYDAYKYFEIATIKLAKKVRIKTEYPFDQVAPLMKTTTIHPNNPVNFMTEPVEVLGSVQSLSTPRKNLVTPTPSHYAVKKLFNIDTEYGEPIMNATRSNRVVIGLGATVGKPFDIKIMERAVKDYLSGIEDLLPEYKQLGRIVEPLDLHEIINGSPETGTKPMPKSTSAGFGMKGLKRDYLVFNGEYYEPTTELVRHYNDALADYIGGKSPGFVTNSVLKAEAVPVQEPMKLARVFSPVNMIQHMLLGRYCLPIIEFMNANGTFFEIATGVNPGSYQWTNLFEKFLQPVEGSDPNREYWTIDFSKYDMSPSPIMQETIIRVILEIARNFYHEGDLQVMNYVLSDIVKQDMCFRDAIVHMENYFGSGHLITAMFQSISSALLKRYSYFLHMDEPFRDHVHSVSLGDDTSNRILPTCYGKWGPEQFCKDLEEIGYEATSVIDKHLKGSFNSIKELEFLKRRHMYNADLKCVVGVLDKNSICKSLMVYTKSRNVPRENVVYGVYQNALLEFFFYGREVYEQAVERLRICAPLDGLPNDDSLFPSYDERLAAYADDPKYENVFVCPESYDLEFGNLDEVSKELYLISTCKGESEAEAVDIKKTVENVEVNVAGDEEQIAFPTLNPYRPKEGNRISLGKVLERPVEIDFIEINENSSTIILYNPLLELMNKPIIADKIKNFYGFRCGIEMHFHINRPAGVYGAVLISVVPQYDRTCINHDGFTLQNLASYPHKVMDLRADTNCVIQIPFLHSQPWYSRYETETSIRVAIYAFVPLRSALADVGPGCSMRILANLVDLELLGTTTGESMTESVSNGMCVARRMIADYEKLCKRMETPLQVAKALGTVASAFGVSEPVETAPTPHQLIGTYTSTVNYNALTHVIPLAADISQGTSINSTFNPYDSGDPALIENIIRKKCIINMVTIDSATAVGTIINTTRVTPFQNIRRNGKCFFTPCGGVAALFANWHGGSVFIKYTCVTHEMFSGVFDICYDLLSTTKCDITLQKSCIWDIKSEKSITVRVDWNSTKSVLRTHDASLRPSGVHYTNGVVMLRLAAPLQGPTAAKPAATIIVEMWCENIRFSNMSNFISQFRFPNVQATSATGRKETNTRFDPMSQVGGTAVSTVYINNSQINAFDNSNKLVTQPGITITGTPPPLYGVEADMDLTTVPVTSLDTVSTTLAKPTIKPVAITTAQSTLVSANNYLPITCVNLELQQPAGENCVMYDNPMAVAAYNLANKTVTAGSKFIMNFMAPVINGRLKIMVRANFSSYVCTKAGTRISPFVHRELANINSNFSDPLEIQVSSNFNGWMYFEYQLEVVNAPVTPAIFWALLAQCETTTVPLAMNVSSRIMNPTPGYDFAGMITPTPVAGDIVPVTYKDGSTYNSYKMVSGSKITLSKSYQSNGGKLVPICIVYKGVLSVKDTVNKNITSYSSSEVTHQVIPVNGNTLEITSTSAYILGMACCAGTVGQVFEIADNGVNPDTVTKMQLGEDPLSLKNIVKVWTMYDWQDVAVDKAYYASIYIDKVFKLNPYYFVLFAFMGCRGNSQFYIRGGSLFISHYGDTYFKAPNTNLQVTSLTSYPGYVYEVPYYSRELFSTPRAIIAERQFTPSGSAITYYSSLKYGADRFPWNVSLEPMGIIAEPTVAGVTIVSARRVADNFEFVGFINFPVILDTSMY